MSQKRDLFTVLRDARRHDTSWAVAETGTRNVVTYRTLYTRSCNAAAALLNRGVRRGDRIAVILRNRSEVMELHFAAAAVHAIIVNVNIHLAGPEMGHQLRDSNPRLIFAEPEFRNTIREATSSEKPTALNEIVWIRSTGQMDRQWIEGVEQTGYEEWTEVENGEEIVERHLGEMEGVHDEEDVMHMYYTSGTTGRAKGATLSHRIVYLHAQAAVQGTDLKNAVDEWPRRLICFRNEFRCCRHMGAFLADVSLGGCLWGLFLDDGWRKARHSPDVHSSRCSESNRCASNWIS